MALGSNILGVLLAAVLAGLACFAILYGLFSLFGGQEARVSRRVKEFVVGDGAVATDDEAARLRNSLFTQIDTRWEGRSFFQALSADLDRADLHITVTEFLLVVSGISAGLALVLWFIAPSFGLLLIIAAATVGVLGGRSYLRRLAAKRISKFEDQLPDTLSVLASSVKSGYSLFQALQLIAREAPQPSRTEFVRVIQEVSLGSPLDVALDGLASRIPTEDTEILVTAINLQQQAGGNLSHVLDIVATTIRERNRVHREVQSLTAQQRFSSILLAALPFGLAAVLFLISPDYFSHLFEPGWVLCMPIGAMVMSIVGYVIMRRLAVIDV